jgi:hypothetical protein
MKKGMIITLSIIVLVIIGFFVWQKFQPEKNILNCPKWINCMPGPSADGKAKSCNIPKGCESITQIAY